MRTVRRKARRQPTTDAVANPDPAEPDASDTDEEERGPLRRCAVTRERGAREAMLRFVVGPDRAVVPDLSATLPGRGIWLSARADVIQRARTKGVFARAARGAVTVPPDLLSGLIAALERRIGETIGLARRAGQAVSGYDKAREWLTAGRVSLVVQATDGSADERARFLGGKAGTLPVVSPMTADRLGAIFGRERAVHVALSAGRLAERVRVDAGRLAGLVSGGNAEPGKSGSTTEKPAGAASGAVERDQAGR